MSLLLCRVRSHLYVATSADEGLTWNLLVKLETATSLGRLYHYPTMLQRGCTLLVVYTAYVTLNAKT